MDDDELIIPDCLGEPQDGVMFTDFSQVQIQIHGADVAEQILRNTDNEETNVEYLEEEFDYEGIQEISDDPDDTEIIPDRRDGYINHNGLDAGLSGKIIQNRNDDECVDITENIETDDLTDANVIDTEHADESDIPDEFDDIKRIPDKEIAQYDAVIENYPDFYDVPIKEETEPFMGTDYTDFNSSLYTHNEEDELPPEDTYHCNGKIILGSKPCSEVSRERHNEETSSDEEIDIEQENLNAFVLLEDWDIKLKRSKCFCKECDRLFATPNTLMAHNTTEHSFLVPMIKNVAIKSTTKAPYTRKNSGTFTVKDLHNGSARKSTSNKNTNPTICHHCNKVFSNVEMLNKHLYELLSKKFNCNICKATFNTQKQLISHNATHIKREQIKTNKKAKKENDEDTRLKKKLVYEEDLKETSAKKMFIVVPKSVLFHCRKCDVNFTTPYAGVQHAKVCKPNKERKTICSKDCPTCGRKISANGFVQHTKQHKMCSKFKVYEITKNLHDRVLCLCPKCHLYFSDVGFRAHLNACGTMSSTLCCKCNLLFPSTIIRKHSNLHDQYNVKPKDFIIVQYALINLSEETSNKATKRKLANQLQERVTKKKKLEYSEAPNTVNRKKVPTSNIKIMKEPRSEVPDEDQKKRKLISKLKFETKRNRVILYYCNHCGCSIHHRKRPYNHIRKLCVNSQYPVIICSQCGLAFTRKTIHTHRKLHKKRSHNIHDMEIRDIASLQKVAPKMPSYPQCESCKITFFDIKLINDHICGEDYETCDVCSEKIHTSAFVAHTEFHDYLEARNRKKGREVKSLPDIIMKYKSLNTMWHIVFSCQKCEIVTDEYDKAVEHSQGHLNHKVAMKNIKCYICNLKFDETCWSKHSMLHSQMNIDSKDLKILSYNPKKLLTDEWFELFESLPEEQMTQIKNKSLYGFERRFQIKLLKEGSSEFTLYCCSFCKVCVRDKEIDTHMNGPCKNCGNICKICSVPFCDISALKDHQILHMKGIKKDEFRVVLFTKTREQQADQISKVKAEVVADKVKVKIEPNVTNAKKNKVVANTAKTKSGNFKCPKKGVKLNVHNVIHTFKFEKGADGKYLIYRCVNCGTCSYRLESIQMHRCDVEQYYCHLCDLDYPVTHNLMTHKSTHFRRKDFVKKKIRIKPYDPSENEKTNKKTDKKEQAESTKSKVKIIVKSPKQTKIQNKSVKPMILDADNKIASNEGTQAKIYKCGCGLHYTSLKTIEKHVQTCPDEDISKENCSKCGLLFPTDVLVSHLCKHHSEATTSRQDIKFVVELYDQGNSKTPELNKSSKKSYESKSDPRSSVSPQNIASTNQKAQRDVESPVPKKTQLSANCDVTLYKCGACNVHYLSQGACYGHIRNHKPVNFMTCINCRNCNLQFTVNSLPMHVKRHHEDSNFDLSKVLIEEYQPRIGKSPPEIVVYIAADKVQSLQVSSSIDDAMNYEVLVD